jgi:hypothetical protein
LAELGFVRCTYDPRARSVEPTSTDAANCLFIRDLAFARDRVRSAKQFDLHSFGAV